MLEQLKQLKNKIQHEAKQDLRNEFHVSAKRQFDIVNDLNKIINQQNMNK